MLRLRRLKHRFVFKTKIGLVLIPKPFPHYSFLRGVLENVWEHDRSKRLKLYNQYSIRKYFTFLGIVSVISLDKI